ncbi:MAG: hypothetical protein M1823_006485, partial [Watsoniomyces obsoletus]
NSTLSLYASSWDMAAILGAIILQGPHQVADQPLMGGEIAQHPTAGVEKLNANGAMLPVSETAASLAVLAKQNGMQNIQYVALGNPTSAGQQNLFIGDGDPSSPSARKAFIDRNDAASAPMQDNLRKMAESPMQPGDPQSSIDPQTAPAAKRGSM